VVEIDKSVSGPQPSPEFFAGDQLPGSRQQHRQDFKGLAHQLETQTMLPQFMRVQIDFVGAKTNTIWNVIWHHLNQNLTSVSTILDGFGQPQNSTTQAE
jgi:hypothetical protein